LTTSWAIALAEDHRGTVNVASPANLCDKEYATLSIVDAHQE
jgi:hypothetical protein